MTSIFAITMGSVKGGTGPQVSQQPNMQIWTWKVVLIIKGGFI